VEESLEVASACQRGFFRPPGTSGRELLKPGSKGRELNASVLLVDTEAAMGVEIQAPVIKAGNVEAPYSKVHSPDGGHLGTDCNALSGF
jgi:hypothetical protein